MPKSPVYGAGRNHKHKPAGSLNHPAAANVNMHDKKTKLMRCGCCECLDLRGSMINKIHQLQMRNFGDESQ